MNKLLTFLLIPLTFSCLAQESSTKADLIDAIQLFNDAYEKGNIQKLSEMITDNYVHTNSYWKSFGRETWLKYMSNRSKKIADGELKVDTYEMSELSITMQDHAAIVTARISTSGNEDDVVFTKEFRVSNFWVFQNGKWLRAAFHDTPISN